MMQLEVLSFGEFLVNSINSNSYSTGWKARSLTKNKDSVIIEISETIPEQKTPILTYELAEVNIPANIIQIQVPNCNKLYTHTLGDKNYELSNHLGNVLATVSDKKIAGPMENVVFDQAPTVTGTEVIVNGGQITSTGSTGWGNSGGTSVETLEEGDYFEWTIGSPIADNRRIMIGLSYESPDDHYNTIDYALYTRPTNDDIGVYESGVSVTNVGTYSVGTVLKIERTTGANPEIVYSVNGTPVRVVADQQPNQPMVLDFAFYNNGATIHDVSIHLERDYANYTADVTTYSDYYPFGMQMPGRHGQEDSYRYGFQGQEKDDEVKGEGNSYTTLFRQYDTRIGRWLSLDPAMDKYPGQSPYVAFNNNPIYYTDPYGDDPPEKVFSDMSKQFDSNFKNGFKKSFIDGGFDGRVREYGGVIIKKETEDGIEYKMLNESISPYPDRYKHDYSDVPEGWEIAGEFHTHPYNKDDAEKDFSQYTQWDGKGMPHSVNDLAKLSTNRKVDDGHVSIVESGDKRYGLVITDKKKFKKFMRQAESKMREKMVEKDNQVYDGEADYTNPGDLVWDVYKEFVTGYKEETGKSAGVEIFSEEVEQTQK